MDVSKVKKIKGEELKIKLFFAALLACLFTSLNADVNVSFLFITGGFVAVEPWWRLIGTGVVIGFISFIVGLLAIRKLAHDLSLKEIFGIVVRMNIATWVVGSFFYFIFFFLQLSVIGYFVPLEGPLDAWPFIILFASPVSFFVNVLIQGTVASWMLKKIKKSKVFGYIALANVISIILDCIAIVLMVKLT